MNKRPVTVTIIALLFIAAGIVGFAYHVTEFDARGPIQYELAWVLALRLLAILSGVFMLRGRNWARWLLLAWIAYHVVLSAFHPMSELITHCALFAIVAYFLFRTRSSAYFCDAKEDPTPPEPPDPSPT